MQCSDKNNFCTVFLRHGVHTESLTNRCWYVPMKLHRSIFKIIWRRKHRWLRHVLRHESLLQDTVQGKMMVKASGDRKRWFSA